MNRAFCIITMSLILTGCAAQRGFPPVDGINNFDRVGETKLYRGAQPNVAGLERLKARGICTIINLRNDPWSGEREACAALGLHYIAAPLAGMAAPSQDAVNAILSEIDGASGPVFVHCEFGCERTGMIVACWRIRHGVSNSEALADAVFHDMSPIAVPMKRFIANFR